MSLYRSARVATVWLVARLDLRSERGASAVEYGLLAMLIAAVVVTAAFLLGQETGGAFDCGADSVQARSTQC